MLPPFPFMCRCIYHPPLSVIRFESGYHMGWVVGGVLFQCLLLRWYEISYIFKTWSWAPDVGGACITYRCNSPTVFRQNIPWVYFGYKNHSQTVLGVWFGYGSCVILVAKSYPGYSLAEGMAWLLHRCRKISLTLRVHFGSLALIDRKDKPWNHVSGTNQKVIFRKICFAWWCTY